MDFKWNSCFEKCWRLDLLVWRAENFHGFIFSTTHNLKSPLLKGVLQLGFVQDLASIEVLCDNMDEPTQYFHTKQSWGLYLCRRHLGWLLGARASDDVAMLNSGHRVAGLKFTGGLANLKSAGFQVGAARRDPALTGWPHRQARRDYERVEKKLMCQLMWQLGWEGWKGMATDSLSDNEIQTKITMANLSNINFFSFGIFVIMITKVEDDYHKMPELKHPQRPLMLPNLSFLVRNYWMLVMLVDTTIDVTQQDYVRIAQASGKELVSLVNALKLEAIHFDLRLSLDNILSLFSGKSQDKRLGHANST
ncbi:hypothetical protein OSB04_003748 [Centaurea solstitialis]|uniref:Uncharacterized protein n=1 Tax=Centaurea solstitialis TaxID=347529 RepID=A0AA38WNH5_9ASTR|nr:hypothetical protein OSB04_003748 [Centaurea solstitialis]